MLTELAMQKRSRQREIEAVEAEIKTAENKDGEIKKGAAG